MGHHKNTIVEEGKEIQALRLLLPCLQLTLPYIVHFRFQILRCSSGTTERLKGTRLPATCRWGRFSNACTCGENSIEVASIP